MWWQCIDPDQHWDWCKHGLHFTGWYGTYNYLPVPINISEQIWSAEHLGNDPDPHQNAGNPSTDIEDGDYGELVFLFVE